MILLFGGQYCYPEGGWNDFKGRYMDIPSAMYEANQHKAGMYTDPNRWDWYHLVDATTGDMVVTGGKGQMNIEIEVVSDPTHRPPGNLEAEWHAVRLFYIEEGHLLGRSTPFYVPIALPFEVLERVINDAAGLGRDRADSPCSELQDCMELNDEAGNWSKESHEY